MKMPDISLKEAQPRWGAERRLEFIDFRLLWDRTVNRTELVEFFSISPQQASSDLATYQRLAPKNIAYDKSRKTYIATHEFKPVIARDDAQTFLAQITGLKDGTVAPANIYLGWRPPYDTVKLPARPVETATLTRLLWAIRRGEDLKVGYQSMRRPAPTKRWIAPHALGFDGQRWHIRAWCFENNDFRDFVISRIQGVDEARPTNIAPADDEWWQSHVDLVVRPRKGLTPGQRAAIEIDYGMTKGQLIWRCRKALAFYVIRQLRLDWGGELPLLVQPLELANAEELAPIIKAAAKAPDINLNLSRSERSTQ